MSAQATTEGNREVLLTAMRCADLRLKLLRLELEEVGVTLKYGFISPEVAVGRLDEIGALQYINQSIAAIEEEGTEKEEEAA